jgi:hypothetical protein
MAKRSTRRMRGGFDFGNFLCGATGFGCKKTNSVLPTINQKPPNSVTVAMPTAPSNVTNPVPPQTSVARTAAPPTGNGAAASVMPGPVPSGLNVAGGSRRRRRTVRRKASRRSMKRKNRSASRKSRCMYRKH